MQTHLVIPDTQVKPGVPIDHLYWISEYIEERDPDVVIHLGDHWDMPSLSSYDKPGSKSMEGRRYREDVEAGNEGMRALDSAERRENKRRAKNKKSLKRRQKFLLRGNHEERILRAIESDPRLEGVIGYHDLESPGWETVEFLEVLELSGVWYSHYFYNPMTGRPFTGTVDNRLRQIGHSFTMGHQQTYLQATRYVGNQQQRGLIAGACYLHDEDYKGPQGNNHWRGVIVKHEVQGGAYDLMEVSLDYLCRRYEGVSLSYFLSKQNRRVA